ncbi:MAG TPA: hypothetical protein VFE72_01495 [Lysobacter sp.]|nr:hypothetical protein [Lysobacter sp.]
MPDAPPAWVDAAPLGAARWRLACITRRGVGMTLAAVPFWIAMAAVAAFAGLDPAALAVFFVVAGALVYPAGYLLDRALGGDLAARGSELRGIVGAITVAQLLGWPLILAVLAMEVRLVAFALAATLGAHFLPYGWLYRAPAYYALGVASVIVGAVLQALAPAGANVAIPASMAVLYALVGLLIQRRNRREGAAC